MLEQKRHLVRVPVSLELWQELVTQGAQIRAECIEGLPDGAQLVNSHYDGQVAATYLVFHHPSLRALGFGEVIPVFVPRFRRLEGD